MTNSLCGRNVRTMVLVSSLFGFSSLTFGQWTDYNGDIYRGSGKVLIGNSIPAWTPPETLSIFVNNLSSGNIYMGSGGYGFRMGFNDTAGGGNCYYHIDTQYQNTWTNNRFVIHAQSGAVGIGVGDPIFLTDPNNVSNRLAIVGTGNIRFGGNGYGVRMGYTDNGNGDHFFHVDRKHGGDWLNNAFVVRANTGDVCIGTTTPKSGYKLSVDGKVVCEELLVQMSNANGTWPDYVFAQDYNLRPLGELEKSIKEKRHLPGIPSAKEVEKTGVSVGQMQAKLLEKVEELTLYMIQLKKENDQLKARVAHLERSK